MKKYFNITIVGSMLFLFLFIPHAYASILEVHGTGTVYEGVPFTVQVLLNTEGKSINTVQGQLEYDARILRVERVATGNSLVSMWVEKPENTTPGTIHFSGIIPGGIIISDAPIFTVTFFALTVGDTKVNIKNPVLLLNNGEGDMDTSENKTTIITIHSKKDGITDTVIADSVKPEKFTIERIRSEYAYDNKFFIVFNSTDKGSGISYYEVCEFSRINCVKSSSPVLLVNQTPLYRIIVRAYDMDGNVREASLTAPVVIGIFFLVFCLCGYVCYRYLRRHTV